MAGASQAKTSRALMKLLTGISALSLTVTATVGLAADYEIFAEFTSVASGVNQYAVERLDHKNRKLHHCTAILGAETKQLTDAPRGLAFRRIRSAKNETCREGYQTFLAACQCLVPGRSTRPPEKPNSVFQTRLGAWT
jgi:hypothetical protein